MEFVKRNIGLTVFLGLSLIVSGFLTVRIVQQIGAANTSENDFEEIIDFVKDISRQKIAVTEENVELAAANATTAREKLQMLREKLAARTELETTQMSSVKFKNHLVAQTRMMLQRLADRNVRVATGAAGFSFADILQSSTLPNQEAEVPVLNRQLVIIEEIVAQLGNSGVTELNAVERVAGLGAVELDDYKVTRFSLDVAGHMNAVRHFVSNLQTRSKFFFVVPSMEIKAAAAVDQEPQSPYFNADGNRRSASAAGPDDFQDIARMRQSDRFRPRSRTDNLTTAAETPGEGEQEKIVLSKAERAVVFRDYVTARIPVHFIEFKE